MAEKKSKRVAEKPAPQIRQTTATLAKRIETWAKRNDDDSHADNLRSLLARGFRSGKRKVQRKKT
jgi:hypothetical protein